MPKSPDQGSPTQQPTLQMNLSDDALVTFGPPGPTGAQAFHDTGYMAVNQLTLSGSLLSVPGSLSGLFLHYVGDGIQANGSINYTSLHYDLVAYKGDATFSHSANGTPTVSGALNPIVIAQGDLIAGHLGFTATGGIAGEIDASVQLGGKTVGALDISVQHAASDIGSAVNGLTLAGGTLQATLVPLTFG